MKILSLISPAIIFALIIPVIFSCAGKKEKPASVDEKISPVTVPQFNQDSAWHYIEKQVQFGPRVPGSKAHAECAQYLSNTLARFTPAVLVQDFESRLYNGKPVQGKNIIGIFFPEKTKRILLCAHWDSRPYADHDPDAANHYSPIDGANDGASGVGVLLEIARLLSRDSTRTGIDIVFFDVEDYGEHQDQQTDENDTWGLGSQYWSKNPHKPGYRAYFGILLDMVGAADPRFPMEGYSTYYAPDVVKKVWNTAHELGYGDFFPMQQAGYITDDHYYVNSINGTPTIDIIHLDSSTEAGFFPYWHTKGDTMDKLDKNTLKMVGQTVTTVVYREL